MPQVTANHCLQPALALCANTVYFVKKTGRKMFETDGYGIIDSSSGTFFYRPGEKGKERQFDIRKIPLRRDDR